MCVLLSPGDLGTTLGYVGVTTNSLGEKRHMVIYGNQPMSYQPGANAMILWVPTATMLGPRNFIDLSNCPHVLEDMRRAVEPVSKSTRSPTRGLSGGALVFDVGLYTVVSAQDGVSAVNALAKVPSNKRPQINRPMLDFINQSKRPIVIACFDNTVPGYQAVPIAYHYEPLNPNVLLFPGIDAHDGSVPDRNARVEVDHYLFVSAPGMEHGSLVSYTDIIPGNLRWYLPSQVKGIKLQGKMTNGDFAIEVDNIRRAQSLSHLVRRTWLDD